MLLVIFGLRGFKHELECRIALKCAKECYQQLQKIKYIYAVSVGVTTGITNFIIKNFKIYSMTWTICSYAICHCDYQDIRNNNILWMCMFRKVRVSS